MRNRPRSPTRADYLVLAVYRQSLRRFLHFSTEAAPAGDGLTIGALAETMHLRHHSAVGLVDRLTRRGLLRRRTDREDRRRVHVRLTARGERVLGRLAAVHRDELLRLGPQLVRSLRKLGAG